jgi:hypothetical protein
MSTRAAAVSNVLPQSQFHNFHGHDQTLHSVHDRNLQTTAIFLQGTARGL